MSNNKKRPRKWLRRTGYLLGLLAVLGGLLMLDACASTGTTAKGARLERMTRSAQFKDGRFVNGIVPKEPKMFKALWQWIKGVDHSTPKSPIPVVEPKHLTTTPSSGLRITWFGHSSSLVEIDGQRFLLDPVWSDRASPFSYLGPKRFHPIPLPLHQLPKLDAVVISHDHYDHLDRRTIIELNKRKLRFLVPLGVGAHLEYWGVPAERIQEFDWWDRAKIGNVELVATPARHFSGRSVVMADKNKTLWAGWALLGSKHRVFYSGDSGMFPGFAEIGRKLGPFDATMIEVGAYNQMWADVHLGPEQAVEAHQMLRGSVMIPVHWGTFDLAIHSWVEPVERVLVAAKQMGVRVATPRPGESVEPVEPTSANRWWPRLPWQAAEQAPVRSSGLGRAATNASR